MTTNFRREALIDLLSDPTDQRTKLEKCKAAGYKNAREVYRLQRQPDFRQAVLERMREHVGTNLPLVFRRLLHIAETGEDVHAIKACDVLLRAAGEIASATTNQVVKISQTASADTDGEPLADAIRREQLNRLAGASNEHNERAALPPDEWRRRYGDGSVLKKDDDN